MRTAQYYTDACKSNLPPELAQIALDRIVFPLYSHSGAELRRHLHLYSSVCVRKIDKGTEGNYTEVTKHINCWRTSAGAS